MGRGAQLQVTSCLIGLHVRSWECLRENIIGKGGLANQKGSRSNTQRSLERSEVTCCWVGLHVRLWKCTSSCLCSRDPVAQGALLGRDKSIQGHNSLKRGGILKGRGSFKGYATFTPASPCPMVSNHYRWNSFKKVMSDLLICKGHPPGQVLRRILIWFKFLRIVISYEDSVEIYAT